jgi:phytoene dehydrogenase-like protein
MGTRKDTDVIVLGAGHNGLVCANYLAAGGLKVKVLERRAVVGGAAVTEEFVPGFRNSSASYTVSLLHPTVIRDLRLVERGLRIVERPFANFLPLDDGRYLRYGSDRESADSLARLSPRDAERLPRHQAAPAAPGADAARLGAARSAATRRPLGRGRRALGAGRRPAAARGRAGSALPGQRDLLDLFTRSAGHWLDDEFESDALKAALGFDSIVGNFASPYAAGTAYVLLHHWFGEVNGKAGAWGHAIGGMGRITELMAEEARARGVQIERECEVRQVLVEKGRAAGVALADGRQFSSPGGGRRGQSETAVPAHGRPGAAARGFSRRHRRLSLRLGLLPGQRRLVGAARFCVPTRHRTAGAPRQRHPPGSLAGRDGPGLARRGARWACARRPIVEMLIPSVVDDSLAPPGRHVASLFCQHFDPQLGAAWDARKSQALEAIFDTVESYCPNFRRAMLGYKAWSPLDLERDYGLLGGDIFTDNCRSISSLASARCWAMHATADPYRRCTIAARGRTPAVGSAVPRGTTRRARSCATGRRR